MKDFAVTLPIASKNFICDRCHKEKGPDPDSIGTGYAETDKGEKICYECCGELDRIALANMKPGERTCMYLTSKEGRYKITNWPGSFVVPILQVFKGSHNMARTRYTFYFSFNGGRFIGIQYGDNTQIAHIKRLKR